jgi:hypothetical protein
MLLSVILLIHTVLFIVPGSVKVTGQPLLPFDNVFNVAAGDVYGLKCGSGGSPATEPAYDDNKVTIPWTDRLAILNLSCRHKEASM